MSKFDEKIEKYKSKMKDLGISASDDLLHACTKACGPSIYNDDAETVSSSDQKEDLKRQEERLISFCNEAKCLMYFVRSL